MRICYRAVSRRLLWLSVVASLVTPVCGQTGYIIRPQRIAVLGAEVDGVVLRVNAEAQDFVSKGEALVGLDSSLVQLRIERLTSELKSNTAVAKAEVNAEYAQDNFEIVKKMFSEWVDDAPVASEKEIKEARQRKQIAELGVAEARLAMRLLEIDLQQNEIVLSKHTVRSPMAGVIVSFSNLRHLKVGAYENLKELAVGEMVRAGQPAMAVIKVDYLRVDVTGWRLPRLDSVHLGQKALVYVEGMIADPIDGVVVFKSPILADTFDFQVEFANIKLQGELGRGVYQYRFRPGMRARVELVRTDSQTEIEKAEAATDIMGPPMDTESQTDDNIVQ